MKVLSHPPGDGDIDETRIGSDETRLADPGDARQTAESTGSRSGSDSQAVRRSSGSRTTGSLTTSAIGPKQHPVV